MVLITGPVYCYLKIPITGQPFDDLRSCPPVLLTGKLVERVLLYNDEAKAANAIKPFYVPRPLVIKFNKFLIVYPLSALF